MQDRKEGDTKRGLRSIERTGLRSTTRRNRSNDTNGLPPRPDRRDQHARRKINRLISIIIIVVVIIVVALSTTFSSARVNVTLASATVAVDSSTVFEATLAPSRMGDLPYHVSAPIRFNKETTITDVNRETRHEKSSGTITVYNTNTSGETLDLVNRTRFKTSDGRIYRTTSRQSVPGGKTVGGEFRPGTKDVDIEADALGAPGNGSQYDINEIGKRLSIPGLAKYKEDANSYALTKTKISGGFSGEILVPNEAARESAIERLQQEIEQVLRVRLEDALKTNTLGTERVVFEDGIFITFEELEETQTDTAVVLNLRGTLYAIEFRKKDVATLLARYVTEKYATTSGDTILPDSIAEETLTIAISGSNEDNFDVAKSQQFSFSLAGSATILWDINNITFLESISGKKEGEVRSIIRTQYPQVVTVNDITIFPFWISTMPSTKAKITLEKQDRGGDGSSDEESITP